MLLPSISSCLVQPWALLCLLYSGFASAKPPMLGSTPGVWRHTNPLCPQCFFQWCRALAVSGSEDPLCTGVPFGASLPFNMIALLLLYRLNHSTLWYLRGEWVISGQPCSVQSQTGFVPSLLCGQTPLSLSLSPQMSWEPSGMWSCCITCEHCWVLSLCAGCLPKGPNRKGRL